MYKTRRAKNHSEYDIYGDLTRIKDALADATSGIKGRASEVLSESYDDVKERSVALQENVRTMVTEKPIKSVGIALLAGICLGYFFRK